MLIPTLLVRDLPEAIAFYTGTLDFTLASAWPEERPFYAVLFRGADELHLSLPPNPDRDSRASVIIICEGVDALFEAFVARGLVVPTRPESPVHMGPLDQSWGTREVYIDDPGGNTLIYQQR